MLPNIFFFLVLWERCFCMAANGIREEYLNAFIYVVQASHSTGIHK